MYEEKKAMIGRSFKVKKEFKIGRCKMRVGDTLTVVGYGSDAVSDYVEFKNERLPRYTFTAGTWFFKRACDL